MLRRLLITVAFALTACSEGTGSGDPNGIVSFTYTGAGGGTFYVAAPPPTEPLGPNSDNATAGTIDNGVTFVVAYKAVDGLLAANITLGVNRTTVGSWPVANCSMQSAGTCAVFYLGVNDPANTCHLITGTLAVTQISAFRATGTFSGTGECTNGPDSSPFAVSGGTFDVSMVPLSVVSD